MHRLIFGNDDATRRRIGLGPIEPIFYDWRPRSPGAACARRRSSECELRGNIIFLNGEKLGRVLGVDPHRMIVDFRDEQSTYRYVYRTKAPSFQCDPLHYRLPP